MKANIINCFMIILIIIIFITFLSIMITFIQNSERIFNSIKNRKYYKKHLTSTKKFILAASSCTIGRKYKCVIDIWNTHNYEKEVEKAIDLFIWGWGDFTNENVLKMVNKCFLDGSNKIYEDYKRNGLTEDIKSNYSEFQIKLLSEIAEQIPNGGMIAWDLVRILSIVGGAYIGGIMEYNEAIKIAFTVSKKLQENFTSWDQMIQSYNYGYQFWRNKNKKDRLIYYKFLKKFTWTYKIPWNTILKEDELYIKK